jgi:hypothetical protein
MNADDDALERAMRAGADDAEPLPTPEAPKSTSKRTLKGPMVAEPAVQPEPQLSLAEMRMQMKIEILEEMLREERALKKTVMTHAVTAQVDEEKVNFTVNLPPQAADIRIDGRVYHHGMTYAVGARQAESMRDIQFLAWKHDEQVQGYRPHASGHRTSHMSINKDGNVSIGHPALT